MHNRSSEASSGEVRRASAAAGAVVRCGRRARHGPRADSDSDRLSTPPMVWESVPTVRLDASFSPARFEKDHLRAGMPQGHTQCTTHTRRAPSLGALVC